MSKVDTAKNTATQKPIRRWKRSWPFYVLGILSLVMGGFALAMPLLVTATIPFILSATLLAYGLITVVFAFFKRSIRRIALELATGVVAFIAGIAIYLAPFSGLVSVTILLVSYFLTSGVLRLYWVLRHPREYGNRWLTLGGVVSISLAVLLFLGLPQNALWVPAIFLGVDLVMTGTALIAIWGRGPLLRMESMSETETSHPAS